MRRSLVRFAVFGLVVLPMLGGSTAVADSLDVTPYELESPERDQQAPFRPRAWFAERGGLEVQEPSLICLIVDLDTKDSIYLDTVPVWKVEPYDTIRATFDEVDPAPSEYEIVFWAENDWPVNISYPPLRDTFFYQTGVAEVPAPEEFSLDVASPSLFTTYARISFSLGYATEVTVSVYDLTGRIVTTLVADNQKKGKHSLRWDTSGTPSGIYFVRLATPEFAFSRRIVILD